MERRETLARARSVMWIGWTEEGRDGGLSSESRVKKKERGKQENRNR